MIEAYDLWRDECGEQFDLAFKEFEVAVLEHNDYYKNRRSNFFRDVISTAKSELRYLKELEEKEAAKKPP